MVGREFLRNGSHLKMKKGNQVEIIPVHNGELSIGTANAILKRTGQNNALPN